MHRITRSCVLFLWIHTLTFVKSQAISGNCRPPPEVENAVAVTSHQEEYLSGSQVTYQCRDNYTMEGGNTLQCNNGKWEKNFTCTRGCEAPPVLADGDIKSSLKSQYSHNETVEYICQPYYTMEGEPYRTCINGQWTGQLRCLKPCTVTDDDLRQHNIEFRFNSNRKMYAAHNDVIGFKCSERSIVGSMRPKCNDGVMVLPMCQ